MEYKMSKDKSKKADNEDPRKATINTNPCGICRAAGMPICKGHGAGGAGGGSESKETKGENKDSKLSSQSAEFGTPNSSQKKEDIIALLEQSPLWSQSDEFTFKSKNPFALLSMTLNMEKNTLTCKGHDDLTAEEQQDLDTLFKAIEQELDLFKKEFPTARPIEADLHRTGNEMTIQIPDQKCFDAFIKRLVDKNLLNLEDKNLVALADKKSPKIESGFQQQTTQRIDELEIPSEVKRTKPTPFDYVPKPK